MREFKVYNQTNSTTYSKTGSGGFGTLYVELLKGLRVMGTGFLSNGGGRYIFGQAPDLIVNADGSLSTITSGSTVSGLEFANGPLALYGYFGEVYIEHQESASSSMAPCTDSKSCVGYGYTGSPATQNQSIQEYTVGLTETMWKDPKYGALQVMGQYSYLSRTPWFVAPNEPSDAHVNMVFLNLRYTLPGAPPKMD